MMTRLREFLPKLFNFRPASATITIRDLGPGSFKLKQPISARVKRHKKEFVARFAEADLEISGSTRDEAQCYLRSFIVETCEDLWHADWESLDELQFKRLGVLSAHITARG